MLGIAVAAYASLEGVEAVGLWTGQRWAEYLTFIATVVFVPYEIYELTKSITALKLVTLIVNVAIVLYLIIAKRLFGVRGGGKAERAEYQRDTGWGAIERATPQPGRTPSTMLQEKPAFSGPPHPRRPQLPRRPQFPRRPRCPRNGR